MCPHHAEKGAGVLNNNNYGKTKFSAKAVELMRNPYLADDLVDFHLMSAWVAGNNETKGKLEDAFPGFFNHNQK